MTTILASVIIPTFNGEMYIGEILQALSRQELDGNYEVFVIDSGSTDSTLEIVKSFPGVRLHQIPNSEFGHGKTRNLAASLVHGEFVVYLSHDAIPATNHWLYEMISPLRMGNPKVVAVVGKQKARPNCFPMLKYEIRTVFNRLGPDKAVTLYYKDSFSRPDQNIDELSFYSDVNSATRRDFLLNVISYQDIDYSEDLAFGRELIEAGYTKAYAPGGCVIHSNDLTFQEYKLRLWDEFRGMRQSGTSLPQINRFRSFAYPLFGLSLDSLRILRDSEFSFGDKVKWLFQNPKYHFAKWSIFRKAASMGLEQLVEKKKTSLESSRKDILSAG